MLYAANYKGVLEYDGVNWNLIKIPNHVVRSFAIDEKGTIYIGGVNEIGFISRNSEGKLHYTSLLKSIEPRYRKFEFVYNTLQTAGKLWFRTDKYLFRWQTGTPLSSSPAIWETPDRFDGAYVCEGRLFVHRKAAGLFQMKDDDRLHMVPEGETFKGKRVAMVVPFKAGNSDNEKPELLVGTRFNGMFLFDGKSVRPFKTEADAYLETSRLYHGIRLESFPSHFALATLKRGLIIINRDGTLERIFDKTLGLPTDAVRNVSEDSAGNLWLALDKGITRLEYSSPFMLFNEHSGLDGLPLSVIRHNKIIYCGTTSGLFRMNESGRFTSVTGISGMCHSLLSKGNSLLAAVSTGIYSVRGETVTQKITETSSYFLVDSTTSSGRVWVACEKGVEALSLDPETGKWEAVPMFPAVDEPVRSIVENRDGSLWIGTLTQGVIHIGASGTQGGISRYSETHGLPRGNVDAF